MNNELSLAVREINKVTAAFDIGGKLYLYNASSLNTTFQAKAKEGIKNFVVNLDNLTMIDSAGIGVFFNMLATVRDMGGHGILVNPQPNIRALFDVTQVSQFFTLATSESEALAQMRQKVQG
jgi:anti-anti-sigma factor